MITSVDKTGKIPTESLEKSEGSKQSLDHFNWRIIDLFAPHSRKQFETKLVAIAPSWSTVCWLLQRLISDLIKSFPKHTNA